MKELFLTHVNSLIHNLKKGYFGMVTASPSPSFRWGRDKLVWLLYDVAIEMRWVEDLPMSRMPMFHWFQWGKHGNSARMKIGCQKLMARTIKDPNSPTNIVFIWLNGMGFQNITGPSGPQTQRTDGWILLDLSDSQWGSFCHSHANLNEK